MNLVLFYSCNETGGALENSLKKEWEDIKTKYILIDENEYMEIHIPDRLSRHKILINAPEAISNTKKEKLREILKINNVSCTGENSSDRVNRVYEIVVCDFNILSIRVKSAGKLKDTGKFIREIDNPKIAEMALKTVYTLGLDLAKVFIILNARKQYKVSHVDPSPILRKKEIEAVKSYLQKIYHIENYVKNREVKMGADPEFMLINARNQKVIAASDFFPREGIVGCDNIRMPNRQQRPIAEIRPKPTTSPLELTQNIKQALISANKLAPYKNVKWLAGSQPSNGYYIGGHIHFSNTELNFKLLRALDNYLGITIFLFENPYTAAKRRKKYGFIGDFRKKEHGGFEYRTLGSWLISPQITAAVLCLAKIIASRYPYLSVNYLYSVEAQKSFYSGEQNYFRKTFNFIWNDIQSIDMYLIYKEYLKIIPQMIEEEIIWDEKADFRRFWDISPKRIYESNKTNLNINQIRSQSNNSVVTRTTQVSINNRSNAAHTANNRNRNRRVNNTLPVRINRSG